MDDIVQVPRSLIAAALDVATDPPMKRSKYGLCFNVRRDRIEYLRDELEKRGIDWRAVCKAKHPKGGGV